MQLMKHRLAAGLMGVIIGSAMLLSGCRLAQSAGQIGGVASGSAAVSSRNRKVNSKPLPDTPSGSAAG